MLKYLGGGYIPGVPARDLTDEEEKEHGALMVYDEVMTGFRVALGGAQSVYAKDIAGFAPDITVMWSPI